ncbi:MAG: hypothetical protein ACLTS6_13100 [Anaerobutyricum sp.]
MMQGTVHLNSILLLFTTIMRESESAATGMEKVKNPHTKKGACGFWCEADAVRRC